jgi:hypothetical protein
MRLPNKITPYSESVLPALAKLLDTLEGASLTPSELYSSCKHIDMSEFVEAMDCLFALGKIDFEDDGMRVHYVG